MSINISFGGSNIQRPGAYSTVDVTNMIAASAGGFKSLAMVGLVPDDNKLPKATAQVIQNTIVGTITTAGNATVTISAAGMPNSPKTLSVAVALNDTAAAVATKIITALQADSDIGNYFTSSAANSVISLTRKVATYNDPTLTFNVTNGTCAGLTASVGTITTKGSLDQVADFNDPATALAAIGACDLLDMMNIAWQHGADLIKVSQVAKTATDSDWQKAIDLLQSADVDGIIPVTTSQAIQAKVDTHCTLMSSTANRKERRAFYGHAPSMSVDDIKALQTALNTELGVMASPEVVYYDSLGNLVVKGSHYLAAAYAGIWASQASQEPITYKYVKFPGLGRIYTGTEVTDLLSGHIAPVEYVKNKGYRIVQGVTLSSDSDLSKQELSVSTIKAELSQTTREVLEDKHVGHAGVAGIETTIYNDLVSLITLNYIKNGLVTGYDPASVKVVKNGTTFMTQWLGYPTLPINNFLITSYLNLK